MLITMSSHRLTDKPTARQQAGQGGLSEAKRGALRFSLAV